MAKKSDLKKKVSESASAIKKEDVLDKTVKDVVSTETDKAPVVKKKEGPAYDFGVFKGNDVVDAITKFRNVGDTSGLERILDRATGK